MQVQYRFRFSEEHLLTSFLRYSQQIWWRRAFYGHQWLWALLLAAALGLTVYSGNRVLMVVFGGISGSILGALFLGWRIDAWLICKRFRKSPFYNDEITCSISGNGVSAVGIDSEFRVGWSAFTRARRFPDGLLLFQGPGVFNWLPDAAAVDSAAVKDAQALVQIHVADYRDI